MIEPGATAPREDDSLTLRDGRTLGFAQYGDPAGRPVLFFHGSPGSRYGPALLHDAAALAHVRIISPDRPGHGLSTHQSRRQLQDWPGDVTELADALGIAQAAVIGVSAGGPYALACARYISQRLTTVVLVSSGGVPDLPGVWDNMMRINRVGFRLGRHAPWLLDLFMRPLARQARRDPAKAVAPAEKGMADADRELLKNPVVRAAMQREFAEAFRQGHRGPAEDVRIISQPWGFRLNEFTMDMRLWHGETDRNASATTAHLMAAALPNCEARFFPGEGHSHWLNHVDELIALITS